MNDSMNHSSSASTSAAFPLSARQSSPLGKHCIVPPRCRSLVLAQWAKLVLGMPVSHINASSGQALWIPMQFPICMPGKAAASGMSAQGPWDPWQSWRKLLAPGFVGAIWQWSSGWKIHNLSLSLSHFPSPPLSFLLDVFVYLSLIYIYVYICLSNK